MSATGNEPKEGKKKGQETEKSVGFLSSVRNRFSSLVPNDRVPKDKGHEDKADEVKALGPDEERERQVMLYFGQEQEEIGPIEVDEPFNIIWNSTAWPVYLKCPMNADYINLIIIIQEGWHLERPQTILSIISDFAPLTTWKDEGQKSRFKQGLVKAATAAKMWVVTNGIDVGASRLVAEAIEQEIKWKNSICNHKGHGSGGLNNPITKTVCLGIVREDRVTSDPLMQRHLNDIEKLNETNPIHHGREKFKGGKFYIDENHSHFIFVNKEEDGLLGDMEQIMALELLYELSHEAAWIVPTNDVKQTLEERRKASELEEKRYPFIAILIQGDQDSAFVTHQYLETQIPVVVIEGSGGLANLLAYAYHQMEDHKDEPGFAEDLLRPDLTRKIRVAFPELREREAKDLEDRKEETKTEDVAKKDQEQAPNLSPVTFCLDWLLKCVKIGVQEGRQYLTILDATSPKTDLTKLDQDLLRAVFKVRKPSEGGVEVKPQEQLTIDVHLTLSWNSPDIARELIFNRQEERSGRGVIAKELFLRVLIEQKREEFMDIFLSAGFKVRHIYNNQTLRWLMDHTSRNEFFLSVCCEGILGIPITVGFPVEYFHIYINRLIALTCDLSMDFLRHDELTNRYLSTPSCVEQKALTFIAMWSVFTNNIEMLRKVWPHHSQPIHLALMLAMMFKRMANHISDLTVRKQSEDLQAEFGELATKLLDECYQHSPCRAMETLDFLSPHWGYHLACDVAAEADVHQFLAHQSSQKWLTQKFMNGMHFRQIPYIEFLVPQGVKIVICALFLFPVYFWLDFPEQVNLKREQLEQDEKESETKISFRGTLKKLTRSLSSLSDIAKEKPKTPEPGSQALEEEVKKAAKTEDMPLVEPVQPQQGIGTWAFRKSKKALGFNVQGSSEQPPAVPLKPRVDIDITEKWCILWLSPITKYWMFQLFYILFLALFSYDLIIPSCGSQIIDFCVFIWLVLIYIEETRRAYLILQKYISIKVTRMAFEIILMIIFLYFFYLGRVVRYEPIARHSYFIKMMMCCILLYYYIRYLGIFFPMYSNLGPLYYRLRIMALEDFFQFMVMCAPVMVGMAVVLQVAFYPDRYFFHNTALVQTFHRTFFTLFLTFDGELKSPNAQCEKGHVTSGHNKTCHLSKYQDPTCNNPGVWPYLLAIVCFVLIKLIMITLLYAMFNAKALSLNADLIWKYQRFQLIIDFDLNLCLPPPLNLLCYVYFICQYLVIFGKRFLRGNFSLRTPREKYVCHKCPDHSQAFFWKQICNNYLKTEKENQMKNK